MSNIEKKIVVLDGHTLNPGDLSWEPLKALGSLTVHDRTPPGEVAERAKDAEIVFTNKALLPREVIEVLRELRYIGVLATGFNIVDVEAAAERGIPVCNVPGYGSPSVAQLTFALILELAQGVGQHSAGVREGKWSASPDFCYWEQPLVELQDLTLGLIGCGAIGSAVARIAGAFGMRVVAMTRSGNVPEGVESVELEELLRKADVVSLHCPLTAENEGMINAERLGLMKPSAFLINTGRGPLINEADLAAALEAGTIAGAGLDVLSKEPPPPDNPLLQARNCLITPHLAWATRAARLRLLNITVDNLRTWLEGKPPVNVVNQPSK